MPRVCILEPTKVDVSCASEWGELVVLFPHGVQRSSIWDSRYSGEVLAALAAHDYCPIEDYFVIAGSQVPLVTAAVAMSQKYGAIQYLFFSAPDRAYKARTLGETKNGATA